MSMDEATRAQIAASDPLASTWVAANAGSGKTTVLTNRVARLLLAGTAPQNILCLTYTNAAAANMQIKLFDRLGGWAMMPDDDLRGALSELGEDPATLGERRLADARRLFARALETPGGLKIQTIHSFCAAILRRFPMEAGVSPQFVELDERGAVRLRDECLEELAESDKHARLVADLAHVTGGGEVDGIVHEIAARAAEFSWELDQGDILHALGHARNLSEDTVLQTALGQDCRDIVEIVCGHMADSPKSSMNKKAKLLAAIPWQEPPRRVFEALSAALLTRAGLVPQRFPTNDVKKACGETLPRFENLLERLAEAKTQLLALDIAGKSYRLAKFARAYLELYTKKKQALGALDFDDLITLTNRLLERGDSAQWVLWRLDGRLDHILVDEAQDTSPEQWRIIERLTEEMTAGAADAARSRTLFVVGDRKQSIFSFQGADPGSFDQKRDAFGRRLAQVGSRLQRAELQYSFRSAEPILQLVDRVFQDTPGGAGLEMSHQAYHGDMPGCIDLWPLLASGDAAEPSEWFDPQEAVLADDPAVKVAELVAARVADLLRDGRLPTRAGTRPVRAGDILILVRKRTGELFKQLILQLKARGLPVAGADRLYLGQELAVRDLLALLQFLALPEDDLNLACLLRSPLCGLSEEQLFDLAQGRSGFLWEALRARSQEFAEVFDFLSDMRRNAEFLRPYDLLVRALTRHGGWERMIARLGSEVADPIEAFLNEALSFEAGNTPSLTTFLSWFAAEDVVVKRQTDAAGGEIRVMTVHGAKGLDSPIVILPDTAKQTDGNAHRPKLANVAGHPVWMEGGGALAPIKKVEDARKTALQEEKDRLFYVALTRAESWLILCGGGKTDNGRSWHERVAAAMRALGAEDVPQPGGQGLHLCNEQWHAALTGAGAGSQGADTAPPSGAAADTAAEAGAGDGAGGPALPDWALRSAPKAAAGIELVAPSALSEVEGDPVWSAGTAAGSGVGSDVALRRGSLIHRMLEVLPSRPRNIWPHLQDLLAAEVGAHADDLDFCRARAKAILDDPDLAWIFAADTLAEVAVTAPLHDGRVLAGYIDRLVPTESGWLVVDYKSHSAPPTRAPDVPREILMQLSAYVHAIAQSDPGKEVAAAILWTQTGKLMRLPHQVVTANLPQPTAT